MRHRIGIRQEQEHSTPIGPTPSGRSAGTMASGSGVGAAARTEREPITPSDPFTDHVVRIPPARSGWVRRGPTSGGPARARVGGHRLLARLLATIVRSARPRLLACRRARATPVAVRSDCRSPTTMGNPGVGGPGTGHGGGHIHHEAPASVLVAGGRDTAAARAHLCSLRGAHASFVLKARTSAPGHHRRTPAGQCGQRDERGQSTRGARSGRTTPQPPRRTGHLGRPDRAGPSVWPGGPPSS